MKNKLLVIAVIILTVLTVTALSAGADIHVFSDTETAGEMSALKTVAELIKTDSEISIDEAGYARGITVRTNTASGILEQFTDASNIKLTDKDGNTLAGDNKLGTGSKIQITNGEGNIVDEVTVLILGEVNGDGVVNLVDCMKLRAQQLGKLSELDGVFLQAGLDIEPTISSLGIVHYMKLRAYQLGKTTSLEKEDPVIKTGVFINGNPVESIIISAPEQEEAAKKLQSALFTYYGVRPEIKTGECENNSIYYSSESLCTGYEIKADGNCVKISSPVENGAFRGTVFFIKEVIRYERGSMNFTSGYQYTKDIDKTVYYSEFGAAGDGVTDDFNAILNTHTYANRNKISVSADEGYIYYIGKASVRKIITIKTDVNFGSAMFIIDDTLVSTKNYDNRSNVFEIKSYMSSYKVNLDKAPKYGQTSLRVRLNEPSLVKLYNAEQKNFVRTGNDATNGSAVQEVVICYEDGTLDELTPITYDYTKTPVVTVFPIDTEPLTISGGTFVTIKNTEIGSRSYYSRGMKICRSNVTITGLTHLFKNPEKGSAPYRGFIYADTCSDITVRDCVLTPCYLESITVDGVTTKVGGGYDIGAILTTGFKLINVTQTVSIHDADYWGIFALNYARNVEFDSCVLSRFDAHMGVYNATIKNSTLGHQGINAIGYGLLYVENTTVCSRSFINLRTDYGATWRGDVVIKNCVFKPYTVALGMSVISCSNTEQHDYGYACYMPESITIKGLTVYDAEHDKNYTGIYLLGNYNNSKKTDDFKVLYKYTEPKRISISFFEAKSGLSWKLCRNTYLYKKVTIN